MKKRRLLSIVLVICMVLAFVPMTAFAETNGSTEDGFSYTISDDDKVTITGYTGSGTAVEIPDTIDGKTVTAIGNTAFMGKNSIESIEIPDSVTSIGSQAFRNCTKISSITIPDSVTSIGHYAFYDCTNLINVTFEENSQLTFIGTCAFEKTPWLTNKQKTNPLVVVNGILINGRTAVGEVSIPENVTTIADEAFAGCTGLTSVNIPASVTSIGIQAFQGCTKLSSITISSGVETIGANAFYICTSLESVVIPGSVTVIGDCAFEECFALTSVTIQNGVNTIGAEAFSGCSKLTSVTIPGSVTSIGNSAFAFCTSLTSVTMQNGVISTGNSVFVYCTSLTSVTFPDSITSIGAETFCSCTGLESITIPASVKTIGQYAFSGCTGLESIFLPDGLDVSNASIRNEATKVRYNIENGEVTITEIALGEGKTGVAIPATICGYPVVAVSDDSLLNKISSHTCAGGEATCQAKAICGICKQPYGEVDNTNHNFEKIPSKDATLNEEGNIEYWKCLDCSRLFADENGEKEISLADTVIKKLTPETDGDKGQSAKSDAENSAKTGDDTNIALWLALMLLSGAGITGVTAYTRGKRTNE